MYIFVHDLYTMIVFTLFYAAVYIKRHLTIEKSILRINVLEAIVKKCGGIGSQTLNGRIKNGVSSLKM